MSERIKDRVAIVTGSSAGLGREISRQLAQRGVRVVLNGRNEERLSRTVSELRAQGYKVHGIQADAGSPEQCENLIIEVLEKFGRIDILVNNAGGGMRGLFEEMSARGIQAVLNNNLMSAIYMTRYALPCIKESRGSIVFISSIAGRFGLPVLSVYSMAKMALNAMVQSLRIELKGLGIHLGIVYAGFVRDDPDKKIIGPDGRQQPGHSKPVRLAQTKEKVSNRVIRMIQRRKRKMTLSLAGKVIGFFIRLSPALVSAFLSGSSKRIIKIYKSEAGKN